MRNPPDGGILPGGVRVLLVRGRRVRMLDGNTKGCPPQWTETSDTACNRVRTGMGLFGLATVLPVVLVPRLRDAHPGCAHVRPRPIGRVSRRPDVARRRCRGKILWRAGECELVRKDEWMNGWMETCWDDGEEYSRSGSGYEVGKGRANEVGQTLPAWRRVRRGGLMHAIIKDGTSD